MCIRDRNETNKNVIEWCREAENLGAGEILITSVDAEGTGKGCDLELISQILDNVSIPVVAHGGVGSKEDVLSTIQLDQLSGIAISSLFHYDYIVHNRNLDGYESEGNTEFLKSKKTLSSIDEIDIKCLKNYLSANGVTLRIEP